MAKSTEFSDIESLVGLKGVYDRFEEDGLLLIASETWQTVCTNYIRRRGNPKNRSKMGLYNCPNFATVSTYGLIDS